MMAYSTGDIAQAIALGLDVVTYPIAGCLIDGKSVSAAYVTVPDEIIWSLVFFFFVELRRKA
jgi:hypothetical protein